MEEGLAIVLRLQPYRPASWLVYDGVFVRETYRKEIKLATKDETPVTIITALANFVPVPPDVGPLATNWPASKIVDMAPACASCDAIYLQCSVRILRSLFYQHRQDVSNNEDGRLLQDMEVIRASQNEAA